MYVLAEQLLMQAWLPADDTRGAEEGQQIVPDITTKQLETQIYALAFRYC